jgi:hypothetical protein
MVALLFTVKVLPPHHASCSHNTSSENDGILVAWLRVAMTDDQKRSRGCTAQATHKHLQTDTQQEAVVAGWAIRIISIIIHYYYYYCYEIIL